MIRATEIQYRLQRGIERLLRNVADDAVAMFFIEDEQPPNRVVDIARSGRALGAHFRSHVRDNRLYQSRLAAEPANDASNGDTRPLRHRLERHLAEPVIPIAFDERLDDAASGSGGRVGPGALLVSPCSATPRIHVTYYDMKLSGSQYSRHVDGH